MSELEQVFDQTLEAFKQRLHIPTAGLSYQYRGEPQFYLTEGGSLMFAQFAATRLYPTKEWQQTRSYYDSGSKPWLYTEVGQIKMLWERSTDLYILARWEDTRESQDKQGQRSIHRHFIYRQSPPTYQISEDGPDQLVQRYLIFGEVESPNLLGLPWDSSFTDLPVVTELMPEKPKEQPKALLAALLGSSFKRRPVSADQYGWWAEEAYKRQMQQLTSLLASIPKWQSLKSLARKSSLYDQLQNQESQAVKTAERPAPVPEDEVDKAIRIEKKEGDVLPERVVLEGPAIQWLLDRWAHDTHEDINPSHTGSVVSFGPYAIDGLISSVSSDSARSTRLRVIGDLLERFGAGQEMDRIEQAEKAEAEKRRIAAEE